MVIFADDFPEAWFGQRYEVTITSVPVVMKVEGVMNGTQLLASENGRPAAPWMNAQAFARLLLMGVIRRIE